MCCWIVTWQSIAPVLELLWELVKYLYLLYVILR